MNNQIFTKDSLSIFNNKYLAIGSFVVSFVLFIVVAVLLLSNKVDAQDKTPTKEETITNLNIEINQLDLEVIKKEATLKKEEQEFKDAQKDLDSSKDKRAEKFKEKSKIMEGTGTVSFQ